MPKLTATQLAHFRKISEDGLPTFVELHKRVQNQNQRGGFTENYIPVWLEAPNDHHDGIARKIPARVNISTRVPSQRLYGKQETTVKIWNVHVPHDTNVSVGDKFRLENGDTLEVIDTERNTIETVSRRCYCNRVS